MAKKESKKINKKEKKSKDKTSFFKGMKAELKKVNWPTPKQLVNNTSAVIVIVILLSAIVFVLDIAFESVNKYGIDKVKEAVVSSNISEENKNNSEDQTEDIQENNDDSVKDTENTDLNQETENNE